MKNTGTLAQPQVAYHVNVPAHMSLQTTDLVTNNNMDAVPRTPYR
jgi:hypothetical protein